jgi:phage terminase Nu1 subunit (DNA packaging protein)
LKTWSAVSVKGVKLMAETKKIESIESLTVSASVLADLLNVTERRVRQLAEEGIFTRVAKGRYNLPESIKTYLNMLKMEKDIIGSNAPGEIELETERAIKTRVERKQAEIKLALMKGQVHKASDVEQVMVDMLTSFRTRLLNIPAKLAPILVDRKETGYIKEMITAEMIEVLNELKDYNPADFYAKEHIEYDEEEIETYEVGGEEDES